MSDQQDEYLGDVEAALDFAEEHLKPTFETHDVEADGQLLVTHKDQVVIDVTAMIENQRLNPRRKKGMTPLDDRDSFCRYVKGQSYGTTYLTADVDKLTFQAIFNAHSRDKAGHKDHWAMFQQKYSPEWIRWMSGNKKEMDQVVFARFIEDNIIDLISCPDPDDYSWADVLGGEFANPAAVLEVARKMEVTSKLKVTNASRAETGETTIKFEEEHEAGTVSVPPLFTVAIPVYHDSVEKWVIGARLMYRVHLGAIMWRYELQDVDSVKRNSFHALAKEVEEASDIELFFGGVS